MSFFKLTIPPAAIGVGLGIVPVGLVDIVIGVAIKGRMLSFDFSIWDCDNPNLEECKYTVFDLIKDEPDNISVDYSLLRKGRCGLALCVSGIYLILVGLKILIPDTTNQRRIAESYDGNIWEYYQWKRSNMVFMSIWIIFMLLAII